MESYQSLQTSSTSDNLFDLQIDQQNISYLSEIARWGKFLSIVGFVMIGLFTLFFTIALLVGGSTGSSAFGATSYDMANTLGSTVGAIVLIALLLIYFLPTLYLYKFSTQMQTALRNNDQVSLTSSFGNLKSSFKFVGILTIIVLGLYALMIVGGLIFAVAMK